MVHRTISVKDSPSNRWKKIASHKTPASLTSITKTCLARTINTIDLKNYNLCKDEIRQACHHLNTYFPLDLRTAIVEEIMSMQTIEEVQHVMSMILLHLLTDTRTFVLTTSSAKEDDPIHLAKEDCDILLDEIKMRKQFHFESLQINGIYLEEGFLTEILKRSSQLHTIQASGDICHEVLQCLEYHPRSLRALQLDRAFVNDREVVKALLSSQHEFEALGDMILEGKSREEVAGIPHQDLRYLSIDSPFVTTCGAMVFLHFLPKLRNIRYSQSLFKSLSCLQNIAPSGGRRLSLTSMDLWRPSPVTLSSLQNLCRDLKHLMIEDIDLSLNALEKELAAFSNLQSLTLRHVQDEQVVSAVKAVGKSLQKLRIEYETATPLSYEAIQAIQQTCLELETLEMENVQLGLTTGIRLQNLKTSLPELKTLKISKSSVHPGILERLVVSNNSLESLCLDINQDAVTDQLLCTIIKYNNLCKLKSVSLMSGNLSYKGLTSILTVPALEMLSLSIDSFPNISGEDFLKLQRDLLQGNFRCVLENQETQEN